MPGKSNYMQPEGLVAKPREFEKCRRKRVGNIKIGFKGNG
jgi:hypothetical protein